MEREKAGSLSQTKKERVFIATSKGVYPISVLKGYEQAPSRQIREEQKFLTEQGLIQPPFSFESLLFLFDNCSFFNACVRQIAKDVAGSGYHLIISDEKKANEQEFAKVSEFFEDPNDREESVLDLIERAVIDWGVIGAFALEVSRDGGRPSVYHVPAHTILIHKEGNKYLQRRLNKKVWFKRFGYDKDIHIEKGDEFEPGQLPPALRASELIYYVNYYPLSSWYGAPNILPAVGSALGIIAIRDYNLTFFENYGVPAGLLVLEGEWAEDDAKRVAEIIENDIKGTANAHRTLVLQPPEGGRATWTPLTIETKEGHFKVYLKQLRDEVLSAYKMPPYRLGIAEIGSLGGSTAEETTQIYIDSVVEPLKRVFESIFTFKIIRQVLGVKNYSFKLDRLDIRDLEREVKICETLFSMGCLSRNQVIQRLGLGPVIPKELGGDDFYIASSYVQVGPAESLPTLALREFGLEKLEDEIRRKVNEWQKKSEL